MTDVTSGVDIGRPAAEVFDVVSDMSRNPEWQKGMVSCSWTSDPPLQVGSTYHQEDRFLGRAVRTDVEVTEFDPTRRIRIVSTESTFPLDITRRVEALGADRCRVIAEVRGDPGRLFAWAGPLVSKMVKRSVNGDYRRLRELMESSGSHQPPRGDTHG